MESPATGTIRATFVLSDGVESIQDYSTITDFLMTAKLDTVVPTQVASWSEGKWSPIALNIRPDLSDKLDEEYRDEFLRLFGPPQLVLGSGISGDIYKVTQELSSGKEEEVAIKIVPEDSAGELYFNTLFSNDSKVSRIVQNRIVYGDNVSYLVMPVARGTLTEFIKDLDYKQKKQILFDVAYAIYEVCSKGIDHNDITTDNILMFENPDTSLTAKLTDFGFSTLTYTSTYRGEDNIQDQEIELYSQLMYEVLVGKTWYQLQDNTLSEKIDDLIPPSDVSEEEWGLCLDVLRSVLCDANDPNRVPRITRVLMHEYFEEQYNNSPGVLSINKPHLLTEHRDVPVTAVESIPRSNEILIALEKLGETVKTKLVDRPDTFMILSFTYLFELTLIIAKAHPGLSPTACVASAQSVVRNVFPIVETRAGATDAVRGKLSTKQTIELFKDNLLVPSINMMIDAFAADTSTPVDPEIIARAHQYAVKMYLTPTVLTVGNRDRYTLAVTCMMLAVIQTGLAAPEWLDRYSYAELEAEAFRLESLLKLIK